MDEDLKTNVNNDTELLLQDEDKEDYVEKSIGAFGIWQLGICIIASMTRYTALSNMLSIIFLTPKTDFVCAKFNDINSTIEVHNSTCYANCVKYEYDHDIFDVSLISEFDLVCDRAWMASFTQTVLMFGLVVGVTMFGWISDRFGRRIAFLIANYTNVIFMIATPFAPDYWTFNLLRFLVGIPSGGVLIVGILFVIENVGQEYREFAGTLAVLPDGFSEAILSGIAYSTSTWREYMLMYSLLSIFIVSIVILLPETPRWLISKGKSEDAVKILNKAAQWNRISTIMIEENVSKAVEKMKSIDTRKKVSYVDLFITKKSTLRIICSFVIWTSAGICYYGINQFITYLGTNIYMAVALLGFIQTPKLPIAIFFNKVFGRRRSVFGSLLVTGCTMVALIFLDHTHWIGITTGVAGFSATCTTAAIMYVYTSELFPTPLRNMAYGFSSLGSKLGAMVTPFIAVLSPYWVPSLVFAIVPFVASLFCLMLPETQGKALKDSVK